MKSAIPTANQMEQVLDAMRRASVTHVYMDRALSYPPQLEALARAGYVAGSQEAQYVMLERTSR